MAAFCNAKGRIQATFVGFKRSDGDVLLVCSRDLLAAVLKRLSMFVLRSKARLTDASEEFVLRGLAASAVTDVVGDPAAPWRKVDAGTASVVHLYPADGVARALWVAPVGTPVPDGQALDAGLWRLGAIHAGVACVSAATAEAFVPQMLNYESVGGVSFNKGCYPGQEVVARSQFRGPLKRRAFLAHSDAAMAAAQEIFETSDPSQPCATVVQAAAAPGGGFDAIVSGQVSALQSAALRLSSATGPVVDIRPMPYPLRDDV